MSKCWNCCLDNFGDFFVYTTTKQLRVQNRFIAGLNILGMLSLAIYIIGYTFIYDKGYQFKDYPKGYVSTEVKGIAFNDEDTPINVRYHESIDLVHPHIEMDGLFMTTALVETWQSRGLCDGEDECASDDDCVEGDYDFDGLKNGECSNGYCQEYRWCPAENDTLTRDTLLYGVENFTIFLKVMVVFKEFGVTLLNTEDRLGTGEWTPGYNLFTVKDILDECGVDILDVQRTGMLVTGDITYECNFDPDNKCRPYPKFQWAREDRDENSISKGFNFRSKFYSLDEGQHADRFLVKYHGIRFRFSIRGYGGKWDPWTFSRTLGSGIALTAISVGITEFFLKHCIPERAFYTSKRIEVVTVTEEKKWIGGAHTSTVEAESNSQLEQRTVPLRTDADPKLTKSNRRRSAGRNVRFF